MAEQKFFFNLSGELKMKRTEAQRAAQKRYNDKLKQNEEHKKLQKERQKNYYNKFKADPEFQELRRAYSKKHYDNNKDKVWVKKNNVNNHRDTKINELDDLV